MRPRRNGVVVSGGGVARMVLVRDHRASNSFLFRGDKPRSWRDFSVATQLARTRLDGVNMTTKNMPCVNPIRPPICREIHSNGPGLFGIDFSGLARERTTCKNRLSEREPKFPVCAPLGCAYSCIPRYESSHDTDFRRFSATYFLRVTPSSYARHSSLAPHPVKISPPPSQDALCASQGRCYPGGAARQYRRPGCR